MGRTSFLLGRVAPIDNKLGAGAKGGPIGSNKDSHLSHFFRLSQPAHWVLVDVELLGRIIEVIDQRRGNYPRVNRVYADGVTLFGTLKRYRLGEETDAPLSSVLGRNGWVTDHPFDRTNVDDRATMFLHRFNPVLAT